MAGITDIIFKIIAKDEFSDIFKKLGTQTGNLSDKMKVVGKSLLALGGTYVSGYAIRQLIDTTMELGELGAQSLAAKDSLAAMTGSMSSAVDMMAQMKEATNNTVNSMQLAQAATRAMVGLQGELKTAMMGATPELAGLAEALASLQPQLGDVGSVYERMVMSIRRGTSRALEMMGLFIDQNQAFERYGNTIGKLPAQLNDAEKSIALMNEALRQAPEIMRQASTSGDEMADKFDQMRVATQEVKQALGELLAPGVSDVAGGLAGFFNMLSVGGTDDEIARTTDKINRLKKSQDQLFANMRNASNKQGRENAAYWIRELQKEIDRLESKLPRLKTELDATQKAEYRLGYETDLLRARMGAFTATADASAAGLMRTARAANIAAGSFRRAKEAAAGRTYGDTGEGMSPEYESDFWGAQTTAAGFGAGVPMQAALDALSDYNKARAQLELQRAEMTKFEYDRERQMLDDFLRESLGKWEDYGEAVSSSVGDDLSGLISQQLQPTFSLDQLAPGLVGGEQRIDEHYRRLAAIALRGGEEIAKHQTDWADTLALIPADIRAQGIAAMQQWAKDQVIGYSKGLDYSLVDKGLIIERVKEMIAAEQARGAIISEIAAMFPGVSQGIIEAAVGDVSGVGTSMASGIAQGYKDSVDTDGMLRMTATAFVSSAEKLKDDLRKAGEPAGRQLLSGITQAVRDGAPDIIATLAAAITPSVQTAIRKNDERYGKV